MNQRRNRGGWILTALVIVVVFIVKSRMVPNITLIGSQNQSAGGYQFTAHMTQPAKTGLSWVLTRRGDQTGYMVEVYNNQRPVRGFATLQSSSKKLPGHTYPVNGSIKINGTTYDAKSLNVDASGHDAVITFELAATKSANS